MTWTILVILVTLQYGVIVHALTSCHHHHCARPKYCELTLDQHNKIHGDCVTPTVHFNHHYPACSSTGLTPGSHCYCTLQSCVDSTIRISELGASGLNCGGHICDTHSEYCEIFSNSRGVYGSCIPRSRALHETACSNTLHSPCVCSVQACIDTTIQSFKEGPQLHCNGRKCGIGEHCTFSSHTANRGDRDMDGVGCHRAGNVGQMASCDNITEPSNSQCYCDNQQCIYNFYLKANIKEQHVKCGGDSCHVHSNEVCQLQNLGTTHSWGFNSNSHVQLKCTAIQNWTENICTSFPQVNQKCNCVNQVCVDVFSNACTDAENKATCDKYEGNNHMCESSDPQFISLAEGRCAQYCKSCVAANSLHTTTAPATTTPMPTTTAVIKACRDVQNYQQCDLYSKQYNLCKSTNAFLRNIAVGRCAEYCNTKCVDQAPTSATMSLSSTVTSAQTTTVILPATTVTTQPATTTRAPTTTITTKQTTTVTTEPTTTTVKSTTPVDYPICVDIQCDKYYPYCQLYEVNTYVEGRCVPFKVGSDCTNINDLIGAGCSCSTTACSVNIISRHAQLVTHPTTTTTITTSTTTTAATTTAGASTELQGFNCFGHLCTSSQKYCHIFSFNGRLDGRCMLFSAWPICHDKTDFVSSGCECISDACVDFMASIDFSTTFPVTTSKSVTSTTVKSTTVQESATTQNVELTPKAEVTTKEPMITTSEMNTIQTSTPVIEPAHITTTKEAATTTKALCQDKPGVDCKLLNTTNICANPFSHQYCAAFCGHCISKSIVFG